MVSYKKFGSSSSRKTSGIILAVSFWLCVPSPVKKYGNYQAARSVASGCSTFYCWWFFLNARSPILVC